MKLELDGLTKQFGDLTAVNHINLTMTNGVYGLLGVNGAGKTTILECIEGFRKYHSGNIKISGNIGIQRYAVMEKIFSAWTVNIASCWGIYHRILDFILNLR